MYMLKKLRHLIKDYLFVLKHGKFVEFHSFPFDTNQKLPNGAEKVMEKCCNIIKKLGVDYRLTDGTILGLYRDGDFIPHDNDIDIDIIGDSKVKDIEKNFTKLGMKLGRKVIYKGKVQQFIYYTSEHIIIDIVVWRQKNNFIYNYCERNYERKQDIKFFDIDNLDVIEFKGNKYPMPTPIEEWLEMRYGKYWRIPKTYKGDWKEECFDIKRV